LIATIQTNSQKHKIDLSKPLDISIPMRPNKDNVNAWYINEPQIFPEIIDGKEISVKAGASVNFNTIHFNPHAHGTHTECVGHISEQVYSLNKNLKQFFFLTEVISVAPENYMKDTMISEKQLRFALGNKKRDAVVIRTIPNLTEKKSRKYSNTNWTYLVEEAATFLAKRGVKHLLIDLPSIDREEDGGELRSHKAFWNFEGKIRKDCTITEFIFVPNNIADGTYFLNLQIAPFENDASPSKPILYALID